MHFRHILLSGLVLSLMYCYWLTIPGDLSDFTPTLEGDGFNIYRTTNTPTAQEFILQFIGPNYEFVDYEYVIQGCTLSTFHRDVTSSPYEFGTTYPVYTYIVYNNSGPLLSVCPGSHLTVPFLNSKPMTIVGENNTMTSVLFHCDLVHAGAGNDLGSKRYARQYKIVHKDDANRLAHLRGIHKTTSHGECHMNPMYEASMIKSSLLFSFWSNHVWTEYLQNRQENMVGKIIQWVYPDFYNT